MRWIYKDAKGTKESVIASGSVAISMMGRGDCVTVFEMTGGRGKHEGQEGSQRGCGGLLRGDCNDRWAAIRRIG